MNHLKEMNDLLFVNTVQDTVSKKYLENLMFNISENLTNGTMIKNEEHVEKQKGLNGLKRTVTKVPNKSLLRRTSLCSLVRVFDEVEKTNLHGEPFFIKDLVMLDARLRDWKRIIPRIKPSYEIKFSPDSQILKRFVQGGAVFSCGNKEELQLLDSLGADWLAKLNTIPKDNISKATIALLSVGCTEELHYIKDHCPSMNLLLRLPREISPYMGSPREELIDLIKTSSLLKLNLVGISMDCWINFSSSFLKDSLTFAQEIFAISKTFGYSLTILDITSELPQFNYEKNAKLLSKSIETYFPISTGIEIHLAASHHFSECSHFLFTKIVSQKHIIENGKLSFQVDVDWPEAPITNLISKPGFCRHKISEEQHQEFTTDFICASTKKSILQCQFPIIQPGEWLYWNNISNSTIKTSVEPKNYHSFRFEGPEKRFEVTFKPIPGDDKGLRSFGCEEWQELLNHGHLLILSEKKNDHFDSYLLSESSFFVYPYKVIIKTCGISSPLLCTSALKEMATKIGTSIENVVFSRRSFICPDGQCFPHRSIDEEEKYLKKHFPGGQSLLLGDPKSDHWFLYSSKLTSTPLDTTPSFEVTMTGVMKESALKMFWRDETTAHLPVSVAEKSGFSQLTPGADIDEYSFTPCGFSYNGLKDEGYVTVHITPELPLCYISFETTISGLKYEEMLEQLISTYEPAHFTVLILNKGETIPIPGYKTTHRNELIMNGIPVIFERRKKY